MSRHIHEDLGAQAHEIDDKFQKETTMNGIPPDNKITSEDIGMQRTTGATAAFGIPVWD